MVIKEIIMENVLILVINSSDEDSTKNLMATFEDAVREIRAGLDNSSVTTRTGHYEFDILYDVKNTIQYSELVSLYYRNVESSPKHGEAYVPSDVVLGPLDDYTDYLVGGFADDNEEEDYADEE